MSGKETHPEVVSGEAALGTDPLPIPSAPSGGKTSWEEVVGLTGEEAERKIKEEMGESVKIHVLPSGSFVTMDYRTDRVRIFVDSSGKVSTPPRIG